MYPAIPSNIIVLKSKGIDYKLQSNVFIPVGRRHQKYSNSSTLTFLIQLFGETFFVSSTVSSSRSGSEENSATTRWRQRQVSQKCLNQKLECCWAALKIFLKSLYINTKMWKLLWRVQSLSNLSDKSAYKKPLRWPYCRSEKFRFLLKSKML